MRHTDLEDILPAWITFKDARVPDKSSSSDLCAIRTIVILQPDLWNNGVFKSVVH